MNEILHLFNVHFSKYDDFIRRKKQQKNTEKKAKKMKQKNRLYRDILRKVKREELILLHRNIKRIEKIVDSYVVLDNIFVPFF